MKKLIMIVAFLLIPFTAMAGMTPLTNSEMGNTTGQLGLGIDVTDLDLDVELKLTPINILNGFIQANVVTGNDSTLSLAIDTVGTLDLDVEITPAGIAIALALGGLTISSTDEIVIGLDALCTDGSLTGYDDTTDPVTPPTLNYLGAAIVIDDTTDPITTNAGYGLLATSISNLAITVGALDATIDIMPTVMLKVGTTQD